MKITMDTDIWITPETDFERDFLAKYFEEGLKREIMYLADEAIDPKGIVLTPCRYEKKSKKK